MDLDRSVDDLLNAACPSIRYRLQREVLGEPAASREMRLLQEQALQAPAVCEVMSWQQADGWLGWNFHGAGGMEVGIHILSEQGVDAEQPVLSRALTALEQGTDRLDRGIGRVGKILDDLGLGGSQMIRAVAFAYAGVEDHPCVQAGTPLALQAFRAVLAYQSLDDFSEVRRGKRVIKPGHLWPGFYHLSLLARTYGWRSEQNRRDVAGAVSRIFELFPIPALNAKSGAQLIAPASLTTSTFGCEMSGLNDGQWMLWFRNMELLARLGVVPRVPLLARQLDALQELLAAGEGKFTWPLNHPYFRKWDSYTGLMLEADWRQPVRRTNDLTFRCILIRHYAADGE